MKSAGNRGVVQSRLQMLHVHVFLAAPLGARHMAEPGADQHQGGVAVRERPCHSRPSADLPVQPLDHVVGTDARPVLTGKNAILVSKVHICSRAFTFWIAPRCSICSPDEKISSPRSMALICFITDSGIPTPLSSIIKWSSACEKNTLSVTVPGPRFGSSPWNTAFSIIVIFYARHSS